MNEFEENFDLQDKRLSLIDVSFEDDSLYSSPSRDHQSSDKHSAHENVPLMMDDSVEQTLEDSFGGGEQVLQTLESTEPDSIKKSGKYNLRKSLAWDSAFFTNAGVLEPEELSSMIEVGEKSGKLMLPRIEEDVQRSSDSLSTLASDNVALGILETDLFGDIRASIEKTSMTSNTRKSEKRDGPAQVMLSNKVPVKNSNAVMQGLGKTTKQFVSNGGASSTLCKPPKLTGKIAPLPTAKRASLSANHIKVEKKHAEIRTGAGKGVKAGPSASGSSRNTLPRRMLQGKLSLGSSMAKPDISVSSSVDSSGSLSSDSSCKSLKNSVRITDSKTTNDSLGKTSSGVSRNKNQNINSRLSPSMRSVKKLSSSTSPASSVSEWSPELHSPTSNSSSNLDTVTGNDGAPKILNFERNSSNNMGPDNHTNGLVGEHAWEVSMGGRAPRHPENVRPSGLRMPSPKIGFFDGVKTGARSPKGNLQSHQTVISGLPNFRARGASPGGGSNKGKVGKRQPAVRGTKVNTPHNSLKPKSPFNVKEHISISAKVISASKNDTLPLKSKNKLTPERVGESNMRVNKIETKSNNRSNLHLGFTRVPITEVEIINATSDVGIDVSLGQNPKETDLISSHKVSKEAACFQDKVDCLDTQFEAVHMNGKMQQEPVADAHQHYQLNQQRS